MYTISNLRFILACIVSSIDRRFEIELLRSVGTLWCLKHAVSLRESYHKRACRSVAACSLNVIVRRSFDEGWAIVSHRNKFLLKLRTDSTLKRKHVAAVSFKLQSYRGSSQLFSVWTVFLEITPFFVGGPELDNEQDGSCCSLACPDTATAQTKFCPYT